jgi:hypothetical protein
MVVSVVVGLRNMSLSRLDGFRIMSRSGKLIHKLFSFVGFSLMSVYIWFCIYLVYV